MKVSIQWMKDFVDLNVDPIELARKIKLHVTNIEGIEKPFEDIKGIYVGIIKEVNKHPNKENLLVCKVDLGFKEAQVISGDSTLKKGERVPVVLPGGSVRGRKIEKKELFGIESEGMLCSLEELGMEEKSNFIYRIPEDLKVGTKLDDYLDFEDTVLELEVFPNRPDLLSYLGVARELYALELSNKIKKPDYDEIEKGEGFPVKIETDGCLRYTALVLEDVKVKPSPLWMVKRLASAGIRSINNVVDITNYVLLETGHPIHAFDLDLIGDQIVVRSAKPGEEILLLDGNTYEMQGGETLITDGKNIIALGGIMGGELSGINENTKRVLLEVAYFDPVNIRKSSKRHKIMSESSYRFERGVDPNDVDYVMGRLVYLLRKYADAKVASKMTDVYTKEIKPKKIHLRKWYVDERLGRVISIKEIGKVLDKLGFEAEERGDGWDITIPTRRMDVQIEDDLVEEIGRITGYQNIESKLPNTNLVGGAEEFFEFKSEIVDIMLRNGFHEIVTFPLMDKNKMWNLRTKIKLENPISSELEYLKPLAIYGLLESASYNYRRQNRNIKFFEITKVFTEDEKSETKIKEETKLAALITGMENPYDYTDKREVSFFTLKGILEELLDHLNIKARFERMEEEGFMSSQSAKVYVNDEEIGFIARVKGKILKEYYEINSPVYLFEISLDKLYKLRKQKKKVTEFLNYPAVRRDISFFLRKELKYEDFERIVLEEGKELIEEIRIIDLYRSEKLKDRVSVTVSIIYRSKERTLTDEEVNTIFQRTKDRLKEELKLEIRE